jgi:hypothetical protein
MKTYFKIVFVLAVLDWIIALMDTSLHNGAYWFGYLIAAPLAWALPFRGLVWLYNKIFHSKPAAA